MKELLIYKAFLSDSFAFIEGLIKVSDSYEDKMFSTLNVMYLILSYFFKVFSCRKRFTERNFKTYY